MASFTALSSTMVCYMLNVYLQIYLYTYFARKKKIQIAIVIYFNHQVILVQEPEVFELSSAGIWSFYKDVSIQGKLGKANNVTCSLCDATAACCNPTWACTDHIVWRNVLRRKWILMLLVYQYTGKIIIKMHTSTVQQLRKLFSNFSTKIWWLTNQSPDLQKQSKLFWI